MSLDDKFFIVFRNSRWLLSFSPSILFRSVRIWVVAINMLKFVLIYVECKSLTLISSVARSSVVNCRTKTFKKKGEGTDSKLETLYIVTTLIIIIFIFPQINLWELSNSYETMIKEVNQATLLICIKNTFKSSVKILSNPNLTNRSEV